jgi:hypothetical protein
MIGEWADTVRHLGGEEYVRADLFAAFESQIATLTAERDAARALRNPHDTGVFDVVGKPIMEGDRVLDPCEGPHTKREYWNPEYVVIWEAPKFTLRHVGGGKSTDNFDFLLRNARHNLRILAALEKPE